MIPRTFCIRSLSHERRQQHGLPSYAHRFSTYLEHGKRLLLERFCKANGNLGVGVTGVDPYNAGGKEDLIVGFNGVASITGMSGSRTAASLRAGTNAPRMLTSRAAAATER